MPSPIEARALPKGAPTTDYTNPALLPALSQLRQAKTTLATRMIFDNTPKPLHARLVDHMAGRQHYERDVVEEAIRTVGIAALKRELGHARTAGILNHYFPESRG